MHCDAVGIEEVSTRRDDKTAPNMQRVQLVTGDDVDQLRIPSFWPYQYLECRMLKIKAA